MKNILLVGFFVILAQLTFAQVTYKLTKLEPIPIGEKVNPMQLDEGFSPEMKYKEPPKHYDKRIDKVKEEINLKYPRRASEALNSRGLVDPPVVITGFESNQVTGPPTDNSLGASDNGIIISAVNRSIQFRDDEGRFIRNFPLSSFAQGLSFGANMYDPRVIYDQETNRFCIIWLAGNESETSQILLAFSSDEDVTKTWNVYQIDGSPFGPGEWTDYPMLSMTKDKLILTINLIRDREPWETGFAQTLIYQIDKSTGYAGTDLDVNMISDINFGSMAIRNLHPVKSADGVLESEQYFLSNRNFSIQNDTFFVLRLPGDSSEPLEIDFRTANETYGVPPNGKQATGPDLSTNDARVLDAFRTENQIQFVGNTLDAATGKAAIYHGFIDDLNGSKTLSTRILTHPVRDLGYPGIAWTGEQDSESDAIIVAEHTSAVDFPGFSTLYIDENRDCSDWIDVRAGKALIAGGGSGTSRWGDYIGCQRVYNDPGAVWVSSMATNVGSPITYNALLYEPSKPISGTIQIETAAPEIKLSPNPASERVVVSMEIPEKKFLRMAIYDMQGKEVALLFADRSKRIGLLEYSFDVSPLQSGMYLFKATLAKEEIAIQKFMKN